MSPIALGVGGVAALLGSASAAAQAACSLNTLNDSTLSRVGDSSKRMSFAFVGNPRSETHWDLYLTSDGRKGNIIRMDDGNMAVRRADALRSLPQHGGVWLLSGPAMQTVVEVEKESSSPSLKAVSANTAV